MTSSERARVEAAFGVMYLSIYALPPSPRADDGIEEGAPKLGGG